MWVIFKTQRDRGKSNGSFSSRRQRTWRVIKPELRGENKSKSIVMQQEKNQTCNPEKLTQLRENSRTEYKSNPRQNDKLDISASNTVANAD